MATVHWWLCYTAMLSATAFFGAKARASECVKACLHTQRAQPRFAESRGSTTRIFTRTGGVIRNNWKFFVAPRFFCRFTKQFLVAHRVNFSIILVRLYPWLCCPLMHIKNLDSESAVHKHSIIKQIQLWHIQFTHRLTNYCLLKSSATASARTKITDTIVTLIFNNTSSERSHVARRSRTVRVTFSECC